MAAESSNSEAQELEALPEADLLGDEGGLEADPTQGFRALEDATPPREPGPPGPEPEPENPPGPDYSQLEPYSSQEILQAAGLAVLGVASLLKAGPASEAEVRAFHKRFEWVQYPIVQTTLYLDALRVGEALRDQFGLAKGRLPGLDRGGDTPPWVRLLAAGVGLGMAGFGALGAMRAERESKAKRESTNA